MSYYKDVDGERLLCWGRPGTRYTVFIDDWTLQKTDNWFYALGNAAWGSYKSEYPVAIREVEFEKDYGVDRLIGTKKVWKIMCADNLNITVTEGESE